MSQRIRSIKPAWLDDEQLAMAGSDARVLSIALILLADDYGNGRAAPLLLAGRVFPGKPLDVLRTALAELAEIRFVHLYELDGQKYFSLRNWSKHQRVDKPGKPSVPAPYALPESIPGSPANIPGPSAPDRKGREGKGEEWSGADAPGADAPPSADSPPLPEPAQAALALDLPKPSAAPAPAAKPKADKPTKTGALAALKAALSAEMAKQQDVAPSLSKSQESRVAARILEFAQNNRCAIEIAAAMLAASWALLGNGNVWKLCDVPFRQANAARASPMVQRDQREEIDGKLASLGAELEQLKGKHAQLISFEDQHKRESVELEIAAVKAEMRDLKARR